MMAPDTTAEALEAGKAPKDAVEVPLAEEKKAEAEKIVPKELPADGHRLYCVTIITSDKRFEILKAAMEAIEKGQTQMYRGAAVSAKLLPKVRIDIVVSKISPRTIIEVAKKALYTGKYGDGKVFVSTIDNAVKIRTGEEGYDALQDYPIEEEKK